MLSRREWIRRLLALVGVAGLIEHSHAAETPTNKVSKEVSKYQEHPNNMQMCGMCKFYIPPGGQPGSGMMGGHMMDGGHMGGMMGGGMMGSHMGGMMAAGTCQVVEGSISPMG